MSLTLRHYDKKPVTLDRGWEYPKGGRANGKPAGLWVSVQGDYDWPWFCHAETFGLEEITYEHEVTLAPGANILYIHSGRELRDFHERYPGKELYPGQADHDERYRPLDWAAVAAEYDGIMIPTYLWEERLDGPLWYYGWDCASGCIWNMKAIASVRWMIPEVERFRARMGAWIDIAFEQASNRLRYGISDPHGGAGCQLYPLNHPMFPKPNEGEKS